MTATPPGAGPAPAAGGRGGFGRLLRSEWTKIRSVRSTAVLLLLTVGLTVPVSLLAVASSRTERPRGQLKQDRFHFVHQPLTGDGTITVRISSQADSHEWAKAGVMIKQSVRNGTPYAAVMVTPRHGVRWQADYALPDVAGGAGGAPRWLRLTRSGSALTGFESTDGRGWTPVGSTVLALPRTVEVGMFVTSPGVFTVVQHGNQTTSGRNETVGRAVFDNVTLRPTAPAAAGRWQDLDVGGIRSRDQVPDGFTPPVPGTANQAGGVFTVTGSGDIGGVSPTEGADDDIVLNSLSGVQLGLIVIVVLGVLFATSEYKTGIVRTTFAAEPRRLRVFAAKAVVVGTAAFAAGLVAAAAAFLATQPTLHRNGFRPPAYPYAGLTDGPVVRAVVGTGLLLAVIAVFSLAVGAVLRRSAGAITLILALVILPQLIVPNLALSAQRWVNRLTPMAGLAIQQTRHRFDTAIAPWAGFGVLCGYAAAALAVAFWLLRRRDA